MNRPTLELADIIRSAGEDFIGKQQSRIHRKVLSAIVRCRTAALGGHQDCCARCGTTVAISYNSCRNRHCPKCLTNARNRWIAKRTQELLPVPYVHLVFTLPHRLGPLFLRNKRLLYGLLLRASAATILEVAANPEHLGAEAGFFSVLHTWGQNLLLHPHVHCVIPAGGLSPDHEAWITPRYRFFLPRGVLRSVFRGKFIHGLKRAYRRGELQLPGDLRLLADEKAFRAFLRTLHVRDWVVHLKPPFGGPNHLVHYLARYTHRVAISNHRLVACTDGKVTFRWKDYANQSRQRMMTLTSGEFLRRFLLHTLPPRFVRVRLFGFMANRRRGALLPECKRLLGLDPEPQTPQADKPPAWLCDLCGGVMTVIRRFTAAQLSELSAESCVMNTS